MPAGQTIRPAERDEAKATFDRAIEQVPPDRRGGAGGELIHRCVRTILLGGWSASVTRHGSAQ